MNQGQNFSFLIYILSKCTAYQTNQDKPLFNDYMGKNLCCGIDYLLLD